MTTVMELNKLDNLDQEDREKIEYFIKLLMNQNKYKKLQKEIEERRNEIKNGEILSHDEIWEAMKCSK